MPVFYIPNYLSVSAFAFWYSGAVAKNQTTVGGAPSSKKKDCEPFPVGVVRCKESGAIRRATENRDYRAYVGTASNYDVASAAQFNLLTLLGLEEHHYLLDIGCGSLRAGRLFIPYLLPERYYGIEPNLWLIEEGIKNELGDDLIALKRPVFSGDNSFFLSDFGRAFDFIIAQSIFSHAPQEQITKCLSEAKKVMKPNTVFIVTFVEGDQNYEGNAWVYPNFVTYTMEHMANLINKQGLTVGRILNWYHPDVRQTWMRIVHPESRNHNPDACPRRSLDAVLNDDLGKYNAVLARKGFANLLNETGQVIWRLCDGTRTRPGILQALHAHYPEVEEAVLGRDLDEFLNSLADQGFLRSSGEAK